MSVDIELEVDALEGAARAYAVAQEAFAAERDRFSRLGSGLGSGWDGSAFVAFQGECSYLLLGVYAPGVDALGNTAQVLAGAAESARGLCDQAAAAASALGGQVATSGTLRYSSFHAAAAREHALFASDNIDDLCSRVSSAVSGILLETTSCDLREEVLWAEADRCRESFRSLDTSLSALEAGLEEMLAPVSAASGKASEAAGLVVGGSAAIYANGTLDADLVRELMSRPTGMITPSEMAALKAAYQSILKAGDEDAMVAFIRAGFKEIQNGTKQAWVEVSGGNSGYFEERPVVEFVPSGNLSLFLETYFGQRYKDTGGDSVFGEGGAIDPSLLYEMQSTVGLLAGFLGLQGPEAHISFPVGPGATAYYDTSFVARVNSSSDVSVEFALGQHGMFLSSFAANTEGADVEVSTAGGMFWYIYQISNGSSGLGNVTAKAGSGFEKTEGVTKVEYSVESDVTGGTLESAVGLAQAPTGGGVQWSGAEAAEPYGESPYFSTVPAIDIPAPDPAAAATATGLGLLVAALIMLPPIGVPG